MANISFLQQPAPISLTGNPIVFRIAGRHAGAAESFYRLGYKLLVNDVEIVETDHPVSAVVDSDILPVDWDREQAGVIEIDLFDIIKQNIKGHFSFPEPSAVYTDVHAVLPTISLVAFERYDDQENTLSATDFKVLPGTISDFKQGRLNSLDKTWYDQLIENKNFLTNAPTEKITDIYAPERLYFLFPAAGSYKLKFKEYYNDNTNYTSVRLIFTVNANQLNEFFVGYNKTRTIVAKKLIKYEVWISDAEDNQYSEIRSFIIDYSYQSYARYFMFLNQLGAYELIRTTGKVSKNQKIDKTFIKKRLPKKFTHLDRREEQSGCTVDTTYTINTGFATNKFANEWAQEFLCSNDVYWLKMGEAYPVTVQDSKRLVSDDGNYNPNGDFTLTHALSDDFTEQFVTTEPINIGDFSFDFNTDYFTSGTIPDPPTEGYEIIFQSNFSNWVYDNGYVGYGLLQYHPDSMFIHSLNFDAIVENFNNKLKITIPQNTPNSQVGINFPVQFPVLQVLQPGTYKLSFDIETIEGIISFYGSGNTQSKGFSVPGKAEVDFTFDSINFIGLTINVGVIVIDNLKLEKKTL